MRRRKKKNKTRERQREKDRQRERERERGKLGASVYSLYCIYLLLCYVVSPFTVSLIERGEGEGRGGGGSRNKREASTRVLFVTSIQ